MKRKKRTLEKLLALVVIIGLTAGCAGGVIVDIPSPSDAEFLSNDSFQIELVPPPLAAGPPMFSGISMPTAPGTSVSSNSKAVIDYSNAVDGYVMIRFQDSTTKELRVQITTPGDVVYTYTLRPDASYEVFPLSGGNGDYLIRVFEQTEGSSYALANSVTVSVTLSDANAPFLRPNQYVNFTPESETVKKAAELVKDVEGFFEKVTAVYDFVVRNLEYDIELARNVRSGYLPDLDKVLASRKGICFDYAALMTAMLRSQNIPTKLVVGYSAEVKHAWINVYSEESGWIDAVIFFDGVGWALMDPTTASVNDREEARQALKEFVGDGQNYIAMHLY
jgi:hypothetical protein